MRIKEGVMLSDREIDNMIEVYDELVPGKDVSQEDWEATDSVFPEDFDLRYTTDKEKQNIANALDKLFTKYDLPRIHPGWLR